ncbi:DUF2634 domain-containing protein [Cohnella sp. GCM10020058]|uniref:DUF2634 domain-containing protein n=1 Tax=Cohnella sp. GCM10020058 TaxID=3317330 RepID=UPI003631481F
MIPAGGTIGTETLTAVLQPSLTYRIRTDTGQAAGMVDGLEAVKQSVLKILGTERFEHFIYSFDYGTETARLAGASPAFVQAELARTIREALLQDDRINEVNDMQITIQGDEALASFTVISDLGAFGSEVTARV